MHFPRLNWYLVTTGAVKRNKHQSQYSLKLGWLPIPSPRTLFWLSARESLGFYAPLAYMQKNHFRSSHNSKGHIFLLKSRLWCARRFIECSLSYKCSAGENENTTRGCSAAGKGVSITSHFLIFTTLRRPERGLILGNTLGSKQRAGVRAHTHRVYSRFTADAKWNFVQRQRITKHQKRRKQTNNPRIARERKERKPGERPGFACWMQKLCSFSRAHSLTIPDSAVQCEPATNSFCSTRAEIRFCCKCTRI